MGLFDSTKGSLGGVIGSAAAAALPTIIERVFPGGLQGMLDQLARSGYAKQVNSWLGRGENEPITTQELSNVLRSDQARQIAEKLGIPVDQVLAALSKLLPEAIDKQSSDGQLRTPSGEPQQPG